MAELLAFWPAYPDDTVEIDRVEVYRSMDASFSAPQKVTALDYLDFYDNYVTHTHDTNAPSVDCWYQAVYLEGSNERGRSPIRKGETVYPVTPQMVLDTIQGIPQNAVAAYMVQLRIEWAISWVEQWLHFSLSEQTVVEEEYPGELMRKLIGHGYRGSPPLIKLNNAPVTGVDKVQYLIRPTGEKHELSLDFRVHRHNETTGWNSGQCTSFPKDLLQPLLLHHPFRSIAGNPYVVLISYRHGLLKWPAALQQTITEIVAGDIMEIAGEAETAGLSARSIDGYAESYTASATTTVFSARRIMYRDQAKQTLKLFKKARWA